MLSLLLLCYLLFEDVNSQIRSHGDETAVYGGDAHYSCALDGQTGVRQVTWQRLFPDQSLENLATFSSRFGQHVNEPFRGKVAIVEASLSSMSIAMVNVTWADQSCYVCSFNAFPDGSTSSQMCLTVTGISQVSTSHVIVSRGGRHQDAQVVFSCSATGRPAPTLQWHVSPGAAISNQSHSREETHGEGTVTSSSRMTLSAPAGWEGHTDCVVDGGTVGRRTERIRVSLQDEGTETGSEASHSALPWIILCVSAATIACIVAVVTFRLKSKRRNEEFDPF